MGILGGLLHLANFAAPALGVAAVLTVLSWGLRRGARFSPVAWQQARRLFAWASLGGLLVLAAGLVVFGRDGKMATYAALVLVMGTLAFWQHKR